MPPLTVSDTPSAPDTSAHADNSDLSSQMWQSARGFIQSAAYSGLGEPILGVSQIVDKAAGTNLMNSAKSGLAYVGISKPAEAHGFIGQHAQMLGCAVGMMLPYILLHKGVTRGAARVFGEEALVVRSSPAVLGGRAFGMTAAKEAGLAFTTGFTYDAALRPCDSNRNGLRFVQDRMLNGVSGGATMATLSASSFGLSRMGASDAIKSRFAKTLLKDPLSASVLSALPAGLVSAEANALRGGRLLPTASEAGQSMYQMGFVGLAFGGAHKLGLFDRPASKTQDMRAAFTTGEIEGIETPIQRAQRLGTVKEGQDAGNMEQSKDLYFANLKHSDGRSSDIVIRPFTESPGSLIRVKRADVSRAVNETLKQLAGVDSPSLPLVIRDNISLPTIGNKYEITGTVTGPVMIQENGGKQFGSQLREWANQAQGLEKSAEPPTGSIIKLIAENAQVRELTARAAFDNLMKGNVDLVEFSQQTIREGTTGAELSPSRDLHITAIDNKNDFTLLEKPSWGFGSQFGLSLEVAKALEGKRLSEISPQLQADAEAILKVFSTENGRQRLLKDGLTLAEIDAAQKRLASLVQDGFPKHLGETNFYADEAQQQLTASLTDKYDLQGSEVRDYLKSRDENLEVVQDGGRLRIRQKPES